MKDEIVSLFRELRPWLGLLGMFVVLWVMGRML